MLNILGKRYIFFGISLAAILPGLILMAIFGLHPSIDFTGGSIMELKFNPANMPQPAEIILLCKDLGVTDIQVQTTSNSTFFIRTNFLDDALRSKILTTITDKYGQDVTLLRSDSVGATIGKEVTSRGSIAVAVASVCVVIYMTFAFRGVPNAFRYGVCAIAGLVHDVLIVISLVAIGGLAFGWQFDSLTLTALLTVIGFSVQDTIVVFDRIRENSSIYRKLSFETLVNHSIVQTLQRSINTQLMTSEFLLLALALFGGVTLQEFSIIMLVGLFSGTYSSIFIAAPILVIWENKEWKKWFRKPQTGQA